MEGRSSWIQSKPNPSEGTHQKACQAYKQAKEKESPQVIKVGWSKALETPSQFEDQSLDFLAIDECCIRTIFPRMEYRREYDDLVLSIFFASTSNTEQHLEFISQIFPFLADLHCPEGRQLRTHLEFLQNLKGVINDRNIMGCNSDICPVLQRLANCFIGFSRMSERDVYAISSVPNRYLCRFDSLHLSNCSTNALDIIWSSMKTSLKHSSNIVNPFSCKSSTT